MAVAPVGGQSSGRSGANWGAIASSAIGGLFGWIGSRQQNRANMRLAQFQADANERYLDKQLEYDSPKNQMLRFQEAGLNPHLIYGQGSAGNQSTPLSYPDIQKTDYQRPLSELVPLFNQSLMTRSQVAAQSANTERTGVLTQLNKLQADVLAKNPLLDATYVSALVQGMIATAASKTSEAEIANTTAEWFTGKKSFKVEGVEMHGPAGVVKLETELNLLIQRFNLGTADQKIKAEVLRSKEFQNAIGEIQSKWMTDSEITPQHIYQFIISLLMKL